MKRFFSLAFPVLAIAALLAFPVAVLAQAADAASGGIGAALTHEFSVAPIVSVLTLIVPIVTAFATAATKWWPGWGTRANVIAGAALTALATLTTFGQTHPKASILAIGIALVGALFGYERSEKRAR